MKFKWLKIQGFKEKDRVVEINFSSESASVIYGENGCGKTSLLRLIHSILTKDEDSLLKDNVEIIELIVTDENNNEIYAKIKRVNGLVLTEACEEPVLPKKYDWNQLDSTKIGEMSSILFGVNRGITVKSEVSPEQIERFLISEARIYKNILRGDISSFCHDLSFYLNRYSGRRSVFVRKSAFFHRKNSLVDKIDMTVIEDLIYKTYKEAQFERTESVKSILVETLAYVIYPKEDAKETITKMPINFSELLKNNRQKLLEVLSLNNDDIFQKNIIKILRENDVDKVLKECSENNVLLNLLLKLILLLQDDNQLQEIDKLVEIFNEQINHRKKLVVNDDGVLIQFKDSDNTHGIQMLSSGEKQLLTLLSVLIVEGKKKDIVMIDEPELSLNLKWQREIISIFSDIAPNTQIIVASHSSALSRKNTKYLVKMEA